MATNLDIPPELLCEAQRVGHHKTKKQAVTVALEEYVRRLKQREIIELFGTIPYDDDYDPAVERKRE